MQNQTRDVVARQESMEAKQNEMSSNIKTIFHLLMQKP